MTLLADIINNENNLHLAVCSHRVDCRLCVIHKYTNDDCPVLRIHNPHIGLSIFICTSVQRVCVVCPPLHFMCNENVNETHFNFATQWKIK